MNMIKFDEFAKLDLRVATLKGLNKKKKIIVSEKEFIPNFEINANAGDKIVVGMMAKGIVVLVTDKINPIFLDGDIENGAKIS